MVTFLGVRKLKKINWRPLSHIHKLRDQGRGRGRGSYPNNNFYFGGGGEVSKRSQRVIIDHSIEGGATSQPLHFFGEQSLVLSKIN